MNSEEEANEEPEDSRGQLGIRKADEFDRDIYFPGGD